MELFKQKPDMIGCNPILITGLFFYRKELKKRYAVAF